MQELILSLVGAGFGFFFSQFFNLVGYIRRPRFRLISHGHGVLSAYSGDPPETPWEIELGFFLENCGRNPAKNTRVFVSELSTWNDAEGKFQETTLGFSELKRPIDVLPAGECARVILGKISGRRCSLDVKFASDLEGDEKEFLDSDTRFSKRFRANIFVFCDDRNASFQQELVFNPDAEGEWSAGLIEDYDSQEFRRSILMPPPLSID